MKQHFPELDKQNELQTRKRIPGTTVADKRKSRGRVGRTLQQQHEHDAADGADSSTSNGKAISPSNKENTTEGEDGSATTSRCTTTATAAEHVTEELRRQKNQARDERRRRRSNNRAIVSTNKANASNVRGTATPSATTTAAGEKEGKIMVVNGDLLEAGDDIIIHQANCVSKDCRTIYFHDFRTRSTKQAE